MNREACHSGSSDSVFCGPTWNNYSFSNMLTLLQKKPFGENRTQRMNGWYPWPRALRGQSKLRRSGCSPGFAPVFHGMFHSYIVLPSNESQCSRCRRNMPICPGWMDMSSVRSIERAGTTGRLGKPSLKVEESSLVDARIHRTWRIIERMKDPL